MTVHVELTASPSFEQERENDSSLQNQPDVQLRLRHSGRRFSFGAAEKKSTNFGYSSATSPTPSRRMTLPLASLPQNARGNATSSEAASVTSTSAQDESRRRSFPLSPEPTETSTSIFRCSSSSSLTSLISSSSSSRSASTRTSSDLERHFVLALPQLDSAQRDADARDSSPSRESEEAGIPLNRSAMQSNMEDAPATPKRSQHSDMHNVAILRTPPPTTPTISTPNTDGMVTDRRSLINAALLSPLHLHRTTSPVRSMIKNNRRRATEFIDRSRIRLRDRRQARRARRKQRQQQPIKRSAWLIPADHPLKILWDVLTIIVSIFGGYLNTHSSIRDRNYEQRPFVVFTEVWFLIDILLNFVTEHKTSDGHVIQDGKAVWARYLTSWFAIDVLSLVPWERFYVKPIVEVQKKRGFFKKSFFRTKAVVRVTRVLRGRHFKLFGRVAKQTKQVGVGGQRLLALIIKYFPRYRLFFRNMRGILALRTLRQIHWIRKVIKSLWVQPKTFGGALAHRVRRRQQRLREERLLASGSSLPDERKSNRRINYSTQQDDFSQNSLCDDDFSSQEGGRDYYSDASFGDDDIDSDISAYDEEEEDSEIRRLYLQQNTGINRVYSDDINPSSTGTPLRFCRSESIDSMDSFDSFWNDRFSSSTSKTTKTSDEVTPKNQSATVISLPPRPMARSNNLISSRRLFVDLQAEESGSNGKVRSKVCMDRNSIAVGKFPNVGKDGDNKISVGDVTSVNDNTDTAGVTKKTSDEVTIDEEDVHLVDVAIFAFICCMFAYIGFGKKGIDVYVD